MDIETILGIIVVAVAVLVACAFKLRSLIQHHSFGSGLVAGDSFQRLSPRALKERQRARRRQRSGWIKDLTSRALDTDLGRRADAGITVAKGHVGAQLFRSRSNAGLTGLMMTSRSEVWHRVTAAAPLSTWSPLGHFPTTPVDRFPIVYIVALPR